MELTQEQVKYFFEYKDGALYWKVDASERNKKGKRFGSAKENRYRHGSLKDKSFLEHRLIFLYHHGYLPKVVDHINGNKKDNRVENLREATQSQNICNSKLSSRNSSGHKGVSWINARKTWQVTLMVNGINKFLGYHKNFEFACLLADEARDLYHKEFARHG